MKTIKKRIERVISVYRETEKVFQALEALIPGRSGPLCEAMWTLRAEYIGAVAELINDKADWLEWFICENDCGKKGYMAQINGKRRKIKTAQNLIDLIHQDNKTRLEGRRTWGEWAGVRGDWIKSPDGFRDFPVEHLYTLNEYEERLNHCTISVKL